jgi:hypothetical protein
MFTAETQSRGETIWLLNRPCFWIPGFLRIENSAPLCLCVEMGGVFALFLKMIEGIIQPMTSKTNLFKRVFLLFLALQLAGLTPLLTTPAQALYWEDDYDGNDPKDIKKRPENFFLFQWIDDLGKDAKKGEYQEKDNRDKGPGVNNDARTILVLASGLVGLGLGMILADRFTSSSGDKGSAMFIGGSLGLVAGVGIGALIMPNNYEVDPYAASEFLKDRQARLDDATQKRLSGSFHPTQVALQLQF